jgi:hypothetical protein
MMFSDDIRRIDFPATKSEFSNTMNKNLHVTRFSRKWAFITRCTSRFFLIRRLVFLLFLLSLF